MNRPIGVTILAVLQLIFSGLTLLIGLGVFAFKDLIVEKLAQNPSLPQEPGLIASFGGVLIVYGLIGLLLGYGLFTLKGWAWITTLVFQALGVLSNLFSLVSRQGSPGGAVLSIVISAVIIYYLLRPEVKRAFGR
jgi:uncharacterized membrane protein (DUF2068 family)